MVKSISKEEYENRIKKLLKYHKYEYIGVKGEFKGNKTRILIKCKDHGNFQVSINGFLDNGVRCSSCAGNKHYSQKERENQISKLCEGTHHSFVRWSSEYLNTKSKFICECKLHGRYQSRVDHFLRGVRCKKCSNDALSIQKRSSQVECELQIKKTCEGTIYNFIAWQGIYKNSESKFICECENHGEWCVNFRTFIKHGTRCPSCALFGYNPLKKGSLYCLRSECGQFVKIGISNSLKKRIQALKKATPFYFHVIELFTHEDGRKAKEWEKLFHQSFESANLVGFDGATEWLKWNPQIPEWFRYIK